METLPGQVGIGIRKVKAQLWLRLAGNIKDNKSFHRHISNKKLTKENVGLVLCGVGDIGMTDTDKAELLRSFFVSART